MRQITIIAILLMLTTGTAAIAQQQEIEQLLLNTQKLAQFKQILKDMKSGYQIISTGYGTVKNIAEGNFKLHKNFLDGLVAISPNVRKYEKIKDIIAMQVTVASECRSAVSVFRKSNQYTVSELGYIDRIYKDVIKESLQNLNDLTSILTPGRLRMSDDERLKAIDKIYAAMEGKVEFVRHFNNQSKVLGVQRAKEKYDLDAVRELYGIK